MRKNPVNIDRNRKSSYLTITPLPNKEEAITLQAALDKETRGQYTVTLLPFKEGKKLSLVPTTFINSEKNPINLRLLIVNKNNEIEKVVISSHDTEISLPEDLKFAVFYKKGDDTHLEEALNTHIADLQKYYSYDTHEKQLFRTIQFLEAFKEQNHKRLFDLNLFSYASQDPLTIRIDSIKLTNPDTTALQTYKSQLEAKITEEDYVEHTSLLTPWNEHKWEFIINGIIASASLIAAYTLPLAAISYFLPQYWTFLIGVTIAYPLLAAAIIFAFSSVISIAILLFRIKSINSTNPSFLTPANPITKPVRLFNENYAPIPRAFGTQAKKQKKNEDSGQGSLHTLETSIHNDGDQQNKEKCSSLEDVSKINQENLTEEDRKALIADFRKFSSSLNLADLDNSEQDNLKEDGRQSPTVTVLTKFSLVRTSPQNADDLLDTSEQNKATSFSLSY